MGSRRSSEAIFCGLRRHRAQEEARSKGLLTPSTVKAYQMDSLETSLLHLVKYKIRNRS